MTMALPCCAPKFIFGLFDPVDQSSTLDSKRERYHYLRLVWVVDMYLKLNRGCEEQLIFDESDQKNELHELVLWENYLGNLSFPTNIALGR
jgi:hypothetical protein